MFRFLILVIFSVGFSTSVLADSSAQAPSIETPHIEYAVEDPMMDRLLNLMNDGAAEFSQSCCKMCRKGKACGNSCISRSYTCRKGVGCACDR